ARILSRRVRRLIRSNPINESDHWRRSRLPEIRAMSFPSFSRRGHSNVGHDRSASLTSRRTRPRGPRTLERLEERCLLALSINPTFDSSITSLPNASAIEATINRTIAAYEAIFADNITVNITFKDKTTGLGSSNGVSVSEPYGPTSDPT